MGNKLCKLVQIICNRDKYVCAVMKLANQAPFQFHCLALWTGVFYYSFGQQKWLVYEFGRETERNLSQEKMDIIPVYVCRDYLVYQTCSCTGKSRRHEGVLIFNILIILFLNCNILIGLVGLKKWWDLFPLVVKEDIF